MRYGFMTYANLFDRAVKQNKTNHALPDSSLRSRMTGALFYHINGRFVNRPYETTKVSDSIYDGGSKPPPYGVIVRQVTWLPPSVEGGGTRQRDGG